MRAIVALSGGMDSATVLASALASEREVLCVGFRYGSKHNPYENKAAERIAVYYGLNMRFIDMESVMGKFNSALTDPAREVPEGYYEGENMRQTVVPGRNIIFASVLAGLAWSEGCGEVWMGIHAGDHFIYPDCRPEFFAAMNEAVRLGTDNNVVLKAPFLHGNKFDILQHGFTLDVPYRYTRTCYKDQPLACGKCGSCQERLTAFKAHDREDPIAYETRELIAKSQAGGAT